MIQLFWAPHFALHPPQNFCWRMSIVFTMPMCVMDLIVVICHPTIMLDSHVFPCFRPFEVKISHPSLDIERGLYIAHPGLALGNELFANTEQFVNFHGLFGLEDGSVITNQSL